MTEIPSQTPVVIIGAGPSGLSLAATLTKKLSPQDVLLFEKRYSGSREAFKLASRATVVHAGTMEDLDDELEGVTDEILSQASIIKTGGIYQRGSKSPILPGDFSFLPSRFNHMTIISQSKTEEIFETHLNSLGSQVHYDFELVSFSETKDEAFPLLVRIKSNETQKVIEVKTKYLVGADGWNSSVRTQAGINFPGESYATRYLLGDLRLKDPLWPHSTPTETRGCSYLGPLGPLLILPMPGGITRVVVDDKSFDPKQSNPEYHGFSAVDSAPPLEELQHELDRRGPEVDRNSRPSEIKEVIWSSRFRVHHRLADTFRKGNVLLVGDSAHIHSPAGGQGMNIGIRDSLSLGITLSEILNLPPSPGLDQDIESRLETWAVRRREIAEKVVSFTDRATRMTTISNPILIWLRNNLMRFMSYWFPAVVRKPTIQMSGLEFR